MRTLQAMLPLGCALMPVLKADAYGHGAVWIGRELNALGLRSFCVATAAEGAALRKGGVEGEILVLGYTPPEQFGLLCRSCLMQTVTDSGYAKQLAGYGKRDASAGGALRASGGDRVDILVQIAERKGSVHAFERCRHKKFRRRSVHTPSGGIF